nr:terminase large subunit [Gordonia sp. NB41Y]
MTTSSAVSDFDVDAAFADIIAKEWPNLEGRQTPNSLCFSPGNLELGAKACELARRAGRIRSMPWQSWSLGQIMSKAPDGTWVHPECCLIVPRQNGKSLILTIRVLYGLFKLGEKIIFSAQQWETAKSLWKRTWAIVKTTPSLQRLVESHTCSQGRGTIILASGAEVVFTTRSANAGRGLDKVDLVIYDEAYDLTEADMAALSPTKMAADDPQTIYTSSAVNQEQHPNGQVLAAVRRRMIACEEGLFGAEWMAPETMDRGDPKTWRWANPAFGVIQTVKKLMAEFKAMTTAPGQKSFDVEYLAAVIGRTQRMPTCRCSTRTGGGT